MSDVERGNNSRDAYLKIGFVVMSFVVAALFLFIALTVRPTHGPTKPGSLSSILAGTRPTYSYTCCNASVMNTIYHPGSVISAHWTRSIVPSSQAPASSIELSLSLSGPYRTVNLLKTDSARAHPLLGQTNERAVRIVVLDTAADSPVSILRIPQDAGTGYYNLTTTTASKNLTVGGSGIIRVEAPHGQ
jgi:hypothetical protein